MTTETSTYYSFAMKFYKDGKTHIPYMDGVCSVIDLKNLEFSFQYMLNSYYNPTRYVETEKKFIYEGVRVERTPETESEFKEFEQNREIAGGDVLEIWRYSFKTN